MAARERLRVLQLKKQLADNEYEPTERAEGVPQDLAKAASLMLAAILFGLTMVQLRLTREKAK